MLNESRIRELKSVGRYVELAKSGDDDLGPLKLLPGTWKNLPDMAGRGWNMIALPFSSAPDSQIDYRLLVNQFNEELKFTLVDKAVPNRGIEEGTPATNTDQLVVTLDYEQMITQIAADDRPSSGLAGAPNLAIHHEPGLWLHMTNFTTGGLDIARLATIPHGDSALGLGKSEIFSGPPTIPPVNGLPIGVLQDLAANPYLGPYKEFNDTPFPGNVTAPGFPGFNPVEPHLLLTGGVPGTVARTTRLEVNTTVETGGISNIPFIVKQANATEMTSTFWIQELEETDASGGPIVILQYLQVVLLDFFPRRDGQDGLIRWPHVSINTMKKVAEPDYGRAEMPVA
jgi:hypothetical protein